MADGAIEITAGSGTKIQSDTRTIGGATVHAQYMLPAQPAYESYTALASNLDLATANEHVIQVMAAASTYIRIQRIRIQQSGVANAATTIEFEIVRLSTAGTGGTSITANPHDEADTFAGSAMSLPTSKGTEGVTIDEIRLGLVTAAPFTNDNKAVWTPAPFCKPILIDAATTDGIAVKNIGSDSAADVTVSVDFQVTDFI